MLLQVATNHPIGVIDSRPDQKPTLTTLIRHGPRMQILPLSPPAVTKSASTHNPSNPSGVDSPRTNVIAPAMDPFGAPIRVQP
ncbi:hypothetical protein DSO57_1034400 [Entomophthora muscae]|uniref:Uncharacterized protein n=1 Tax=Entomophthora muscae TaxID=34485 RepID=A0ACC2T004_9FUNG|nr:hypothetical protein DSO57_1034400 [Entomophthora muscae]